MKIVLLEPFFTGSHRKWAKGLLANLPASVTLLTLPGRHWKWRMHGGAVSLAQEFLATEETPNLILATSLLDLTTFLALTRERSTGIPVYLYFHENQITYPWSPVDQDVTLRRDNHYGFINYVSALAADRVFFNSAYHLKSFNEALPTFLAQFPDKVEAATLTEIQAKSAVLPLGMDLKIFDAYEVDTDYQVPVILWNHRWEYDKNPEAFYEALLTLRAQQIEFRLVILGQHYNSIPEVFDQIKERFAHELLHFGYASDFADYAAWLWRSDILLVTSNQDFFGGSVVEAMYCKCIPLLPARLAYPEHLPENLHEKYLYQNKKDLHQKLRVLLQDYKRPQDRKRISDFVARYDWTNLVEEYISALHVLLGDDRGMQQNL